jgi:ribosome-binding protein aMBF1 (putative translation factor)
MRINDKLKTYTYWKKIKEVTMISNLHNQNKSFDSMLNKKLKNKNKLPSSIGDMIKDFRKEHNLSIKQLSLLVNLNISMIEKIENNDETISIKTINYLINKLNLKLKLIK